MSPPERDDRGGENSAEDEYDHDVLMVRMGRVEQILHGEEIDVVQGDEARGPPGPEQDEDRQDRVCARRSRLRPARLARAFNLPRRVDAIPTDRNDALEPLRKPIHLATDSMVHLRVQIDASDDSTTVRFRCVDPFRISVYDR